ncbi:hypothetical protein BH10PSE2_BH10PSE2_25420 [soil metagenome]
MADLSVAHRAALAQVIDNVPDRTLKMLALAVSGMPGERARTLETMLGEASVDRARRASAFAAILPLFRPREDGVESLRFSAAIVPRLWKLASSREAGLPALLDSEDPEADAPRIMAVSARLYAAAATAVRDQPDIVWPPALEPADREIRLDDLARCCDLAALVARALPSLPAWIARPNGDQVAELRLLLRDAATIAPDGAQRMLHMLFGHLADAALILRVVVHSSNAAAREAFVHESELAVFIDRLIAAVTVRVGRIAAFKTGENIEALHADLTWVSSVLDELGATMPLQSESAWGKQVRDVRVRIGKRLGELLSGVAKTIDRALPMTRVQTSGRMTRNAPKLDQRLAPEIILAASDAVDLVRTVRGAAGTFGCESQRQGLVQALAIQMTSYADQTIEEINAGDAPDETLALDRVLMVAGFLEQMEAVQEGRTVRRRAAVAGGPAVAVKASPRAA